jgi:hypothetical protein
MPSDVRADGAAVSSGRGLFTHDAPAHRGAVDITQRLSQLGLGREDVAPLAFAAAGFAAVAIAAAGPRRWLWFAGFGAGAYFAYRKGLDLLSLVPPPLRPRAVRAVSRLTGIPTAQQLDHASTRGTPRAADNVETRILHR